MNEATAATIPFVDLAAQRERLGGRIEAAIRRVLDHGQFIMGPEVAQLEERLAAYCGAAHAVTCASGTDALLLALMAHGVGAGDAVVVPSFTFPATPEVVALLGATPVFADVLDDTFNVDPVSVLATLEGVVSAGLRPRAVIAVDLFGQPADYDTLEKLCREEDLLLIADAAQSFGATWTDRGVGTLGDIACTSFFPAKPLGCYGDGGAVLTGNSELARVLRSLRAHGQGAGKYDIERVGINGRLDTIQAAVLLEKLAILGEELDARRAVARRYDAGLGGVVRTPAIDPRARTAWAQYTVRCDDRDRLATVLREAGIPTAVYYPVPLHRQRPYAGAPTSDLPVSELLSAEVLSLPMHPYLDAEAQNEIVRAVLGALPDRSGA